MSSRLGPRLVALVVPLALLAPTGAHAEKVVTHDPAGDAGVVGFVAEEDAELPPTPDPSPADIVRTVAAHGDRRLSITVHFTELAGVREHSIQVLIRTPSGAYRVEVEKDEGRRARTTITRRREPVGCPALRARYDTGADTAAVSVPTACLSSPRWVRLGLKAFAPLPADDPAVLASTVDDGHSDTYRVFRVAVGPRIRRG
ncbi:hypothetical protein NYO98_16500 [Nocardioides sp. STR2]|uniref:Secreted protein n=1 Tax=Nocardioides pini TaxID=2975053 RepID=A0ABT4CFZ9_9ACTN|nr:hypothetical protein [Nocardioides pini]MCY4727888.1 hypothetical protein [Nocardioides pini]